MICDYCQGEVEPHEALIGITGWVRRRTQGGANAVRGRHENGLFRHPHCQDLEDAEISRDQAALF